ncbi:MAG TPA: hypothetical protein DCQ14_00740 [Firmicutes bacterium]|nr:hypothetical protein [Bacillota bacterium]
MSIKITVKKKLLGQKYIYSGIGSVVLLALLLMAFLTGKEPDVYTFAALSGLERAEVQQLAIKYGITGERFLVEDREKITALLDLLTPLSFQKARDGAAVPGWTHTVDFYRDGENYLRLLFAGKAAGLSFYSQGRHNKSGHTRKNRDTKKIFVKNFLCVPIFSFFGCVPIFYAPRFFCIDYTFVIISLSSMNLVV